MSNIYPFGTSTDSPTINLLPIRAFGCDVVDFNVAADWSAQAGSLSFTIIENPALEDRVTVPVLGTPHLFELKKLNDNNEEEVIFEYIGIVESFSRNATNSSKTYQVSLTSPLTILDSAQVILDGYVGLGGSIEGSSEFGELTAYDFGHKNSSIITSEDAGTYHWFNVSNLINAFGILENDDSTYSCPFKFDNLGQPELYGDFGFSGNSEDGMPLIKLMYALHLGINHLPANTDSKKSKLLGGNLLYGRHNYNVISDPQGVPYYYHFDALGLYEQLSTVLGPQYRVSGPSKSIRELISELCEEANLEFYCYIDIGANTGIGEAPLQEEDPNWSQPATSNWGLNPEKFTNGGKYGGTIRVQTVNKNSFINLSRPFSNIAYNLIGLETPDIKDAIWTSATGVHPGKRPINNTDYGIPDSSNTTYSDPLDSQGIENDFEGFTDVGTETVAGGGKFPLATQYWDSGKLNDLKISNSDISIALSDSVTMKVVTGGYQTRLVKVPRQYLKHYWGDIILPNASDPRETADTETDSLGLNETSTRKIPVVTPLLDPRDVDDFILIDMHSIFGNATIEGVLQNGIYAASMYEIRIAMNDDTFDRWYSFMEKFKHTKIKNIKDYYFPNCTSDTGYSSRENMMGFLNDAGGAGYASLNAATNHGNNFTNSDTNTKNYKINKNANGADKKSILASRTPNSGIPCWQAEYYVKSKLMGQMFSKIKEIGLTHYGKSWYVPVPYFRTKEDLDGNNLVGNFTRSWELNESAYVEPSLYYDARVPQSNLFIQNGKVLPFVNYDHNFVYPSGNDACVYDESYVQSLTSSIDGKNSQVFNFSEYSFDQLAITKFNNSETIIHSAPESIDSKYSFLPYAYESYYDRTKIPFTDLTDGQRKYFPSGNTSSSLGPTSAGQGTYTQSTSSSPKINKNPGSTEYASFSLGVTRPASDYIYDTRIPSETSHEFLEEGVAGLLTLDYSDNGRFCFPYVKVTTGRVFLPALKEGYQSSNAMGVMGSIDPLLAFIGISGTQPEPQNKRKPGRLAYQMVKNDLLLTLDPFPPCASPKSINYPQISTRYVYGPWMTSLESVSFRGKIEYEQDDSLVPENFLIPTNFGEFGDFTLSQTSGLTGLDLAAQGRANSIDNFSLFAVEEGSFTIPAAPAISRIGDSLYGLQQVTDIRVSVRNDNISTSYSFKTLSPRFGKNTRFAEKKLTKLSNKVKKIKLR